ncbi:MAG: hypothetical protein ACD_12C00673G0001, partial [uncultured bacterium]
YPMFWITLLIIIVVVILYPTIKTTSGREMYLPNNVGEWFTNIFIFGIKTPAGGVPVPPARLMPARFLHYLLILYVLAEFLSRKKILITIFFLLSLSFTIYLVYKGYNINIRYNTLQAASLPFSFGMLSFILFEKVKKHIPRWLLFFASLIFIINIVFANKIWKDPFLIGFYLSMILTTLVILYLENINFSKNNIIINIDKFLGGLSYPLFLTHDFLGVLIFWFLFDGKRPDSGELFFIGYPLAIFLSAVFYLLIDKRIDKIRKKIKDKHIIQTNSLKND